MLAPAANKPSAEGTATSESIWTWTSARIIEKAHITRPRAEIWLAKVIEVSLAMTTTNETRNRTRNVKWLAGNGVGKTKLRTKT
jgi:hypothetical protein